MSRVTKFLASLAAAALVVTGLSAMPAQAGGVTPPYTLTAVKSDINVASADLVAGANRVFWKAGGDLWTSDGTTNLKVKSFADASSFTLSDSSPQYTESGFYDSNVYSHRSVFVGDTIYFWASTESMKWNIWKSDGTVAGTVKVTSQDSPVFDHNMMWAPTNLFLNGTDIYYWNRIQDLNVNIRELRKLNTLTNTSTVVANAPTSEICTYSQSYAQQQQLAVVNGKLVFDYMTACDNLVGSINLSNGAFQALKPSSVAAANNLVMLGPQEFTVLNNKVYFIGTVITPDDLANGMHENNTSELWSTDGTASGTTKVTNLSQGGYGVGQVRAPMLRPTVVGNYLYFVGTDPALVNGNESIFRTDGVNAPVAWISGPTFGNPGRRTNMPGQWLTTGGNTYLITDAQHSSGGKQMYAVDLATKAVTWLTPDFQSDSDALGLYSNGWGATDYTTPIKWDNKVWWVARKVDSVTSVVSHNVYYTDGTVSGTAPITTFGDSTNSMIGYAGNASFDQFGQLMTKPLVKTTNALWFIRSATDGSTGVLYKVTVTPVTPPAPALTCAGEITKLKVEADASTDLSPSFNKNTCTYTMGVDSKTSKVDFTPTFTGTLAMKVGGTSVASGSLPKSTKTYSATLGAAGTSTAVDFIFGVNTYRVTITRAAAAVPGGRDPGFTAPSLPNGSVKTVDKDEKKEVNQNGEKKDAEVTIVGGTFDGKVAKLNDNGKKDEAFSANVPPITGTVNVVKVDEQHRVVVAGQNVDGDKDVVRLKPDGSKDNSFVGPDVGSGKKVDDVEVQKDGKIVVVGDFGDNKNAKKLKSDGSEDESFKNNLPTIPGEVKTAKIQDDGKILLGGSFENAGGDNDKDKIIRVEKDGKIDNDFEPATNAADPTKKAHFNDDVEDIEVQKNGKIVVVGKSNKTSDDEADKVVRLNKDGKEDSTFVFDGVIPSDKKVEAVKVKDTGEIYIAGNFDNVGDDEGDKVAKVKKDGHVDTDWNPPTQGGDVHDIELEKHGKVFLGGDGSGDGDKVDKVEEDGDRPTDKPRYDSIEDERSTNNTPTGTKGQTTIHGDGFTPDTTVTIGGKPATVVSVDERGEDLVVQIPSTKPGDQGYATGTDPKPVDVVITVPGKDPIEVPEAFDYVAKPEPQVIKPEGDHFNSDKDDEDHKGKVNDDEAISGYIPSGEPVVATSKTPDICTVDDENRVEYLKRGDCKIVVDAPATLGYADPAPVTEVIPVAGLIPELAVPPLPDFTVPGNPVPDSGLQLPVPTSADPEIPVTYSTTTPDVCAVTDTGLVVPIDITQPCSVSVSTPGTPIYEPQVAPPVVIPTTAWIPPVPDQTTGVITDPNGSLSIPGTGGTVKLGDLSFTYDKAKGTLTPASSGIYFGPIKATINYSWTMANNATGTGSCVVNWGVLKKWSKLSKADQKKYKKPLAMKSFTTTKGCSVNPAAKAALAVAGTTFTATSDVLRTRMWPATYLPKKPNNERIAPRLRHLTVTINTN
ncbi:MAG: hypothetical protein RLZZ06_931 [Actinomycetota bacterium]